MFVHVLLDYCLETCVLELITTPNLVVLGRDETSFERTRRKELDPLHLSQKTSHVCERQQ
jgi:hypothetical protein